MTLTQEQADEVWSLFGGSPLFSKWPGAQSQLADLLELAPLPTDRVIFKPGDAPHHLYLVAQGGVQQTSLREGRIWLQEAFGPGQFFGQQALFAEEYRSRAVAMPDTVLYRMSAAALRSAMERSPDLYDELLHERRAGRLRRIPLLSGLSDAEVRRLAQVIEEVDLDQGTVLPLVEKPGIWIVDWGQVRVTGPANPYAAMWPDWGITAGNFLIAPSPTLRFGNNCAAESAMAGLRTHLFHLPAVHADRLIAAFPEVGAFVQRPLDIASVLAGADLFRNLTDQQRQHLARFCSWEFIPSGQNITTQGSVGHSFVILRSGAAVVTALDDRGRPRPRNFLGPGDAYGRTSLLEGRARDASVRAVRAKGAGEMPGLDGAEAIILDRRDLAIAFADKPDLWGREVSLFEETTRVEQEKRAYDWMNEGEIVRWRDRPHILWLIMPELGVVLGALFGWWLMLKTPANWQTLRTTYVLLAVPLTAILVAWFVINYLDDYYVITDLRAIRRDRRLLMYEARLQAPLDTIQDVTVAQDLIGRIFDFGQVNINTAAKTSSLVFANVPHPYTVQRFAMEGRREVLAAGRGQLRESFRRGMISGLDLALPIPERMRALGEQPVGQPSSVETGGEIIWRKHWINLLWRMFWPLMLLLLLVLLRVGLNVFSWQAEGAGAGALSALWFVFLLFDIGWLAWQIVDWYNDIYKVTENNIIDIEKKPLGLSAKQREAPLERVQTVDSKQEGILQYLLDYGTVIIRTAAVDEGLDFPYVPHPQAVQTIIFQRLDAFQRKQAEQRALRQQQEMIEGLSVYHQLQQGR